MDLRAVTTISLMALSELEPKKCGLGAEKYTNHCLRVTAINTLKRRNYSNKDVRSVSGHKSSNSLEIYERTDDSTKIRMGSDLGQILVNPNPTVPAITYPVMQPAPQQQNVLALPPPIVIKNQPASFNTIDQIALAVIRTPIQAPTVPKQIVAVPDETSTVLVPNTIPQNQLMLSDEEIVNIIQQCEKENESRMMLSQQQQIAHDGGKSITSQ